MDGSLGELSKSNKDWYGESVPSPPSGIPALHLDRMSTSRRFG